MPLDFARYDARGYRTVEVAEGYAEWARIYDRRAPDAVDLPLLARLTSIDWKRAAPAVDLACGTGRIAAWLARERSLSPIDGVDCSPPMLAQARAKGIYRRAIEGDVGATGLDAGAYGLAVCSLAACHLPALDPLFAEAARLVRAGGSFALVDFHPFFLLKGIPTHFDAESGETIAIRNHVHLISDHVQAAGRHGWTLAEMHERVVDEEWARAAGGPAKYLGQPIGFAMVWRR